MRDIKPGSKHSGLTLMYVSANPAQDPSSTDDQHLLADTENIAHQAFFRSAARNATQLSLLDPSIFPMPYSAADPPSADFSTTPNAQRLEPNMEVRMHPPAAPVRSPPHPKDRPFPISPDTLAQEIKELANLSPEYAVACEEARRKVASDPRNQESATQPGDDITVTTLGTGSAIPSKYRNVSATYLDIPGVGGILLDCGEGSMGQLRRRFGPEGTRETLKNMRMIYISHMHADHHLGLHP
jgi:ribonuclease Z